jgi:hypothetical protein
VEHELRAELREHRGNEIKLAHGDAAAQHEHVELGVETIDRDGQRVGGVDFAILEDRKFKSGPAGKIPEMGPRPDHINDPSYDPATVDLPGLELLGGRQEKFLGDWGQDWTGASMKAVLSQTAFCGAVHMHGRRDDRLLADLDCNGWPQTPRNRALEGYVVAPRVMGSRGAPER